MGSPETDVTAGLAGFASNLQLGQIPPDVVATAKLLLLDALAAGFTGWTSPETGLLLATAKRLFAGGDSTVMGGEPASLGAATMTNGYLITARSFCDLHQPTLCHVTPVIVPPVLALAEREDVDGATLITALCAGMEANVRIGLALDYPEFRSRGWHTPGVAGTIGGALGAARVLGFDPDHAEGAMGLAASQAAGTFASFGTPAIKFHQSRAALAALISADLTHSGFIGPSSVLEAKDGGVLNTFSNGGRPERAIDGLGEEWRIEEITIRLWPAAAALQSILTITDEEEVPDASQINSVRVALSPASYDMNAAMGWATTFEATLSARYVTAAALVAGDFWLDQLEGDRLGDPEVGDFARKKVTVVKDASLPEGGASILLELGNGEEFSVTREHPRGSPEHPATWRDVSAKLVRAVEPGCGADRAGEIIAAVSEVETLDSASELTRLLAR